MAAADRTPGSWYAVTASNGGLVDQAVVFSDHETNGEPTFLADTMPVDDDVPVEQRRANAHLFAASGDLFDALQLMLSDYRSEGCPDPTCSVCKASKAAEAAAEAAIAKAEGQPAPKPVLPRGQMLVDVSDTLDGEPHSWSVDLAECYAPEDGEAFEAALSNLQATGLHVEGGGAAAVSYLRRADRVRA